jgi:hypothetical protein
VSFHVLSICIWAVSGFPTGSARVAAPYLILAGDIGDPNSEEYCLFLQHCATLFDGVFMVLGTTKRRGGSLTAVAAVQAICDTRQRAPVTNGRGLTYIEHSRCGYDAVVTRHPGAGILIRSVSSATTVGSTASRVHVNNALHASDVKWIDTHFDSGRR